MNECNRWTIIHTTQSECAKMFRALMIVASLVGASAFVPTSSRMGKLLESVCCSEAQHTCVCSLWDVS